MKCGKEGSGRLSRTTREGGPDVPPSRTITMYSNGFTVDDGAFRALDDPTSQAFIKDLARG